MVENSSLKARTAALKTLLSLGSPQGNEAWEDTPLWQALEPRDRAFAHALVMATLRRGGQADAVMAHFMEKPLAEHLRVPRMILRLGVVQILFAGVPDHAAVSTTVDMMDEEGFSKLKGLTNAVLRRVVSEGPGLIPRQHAGKLNTPPWLWESWVKTYGEQAAAAIAQAHLQQPPLDITVKNHPEVWAERLQGKQMPSGSIRCAEAGDVRALSGFAEGQWWVQDAASAMPVRLLGDLNGKSVIDLCAAPGGKTAQLATAGAKVIAVERSANRTDRLRENLQRLQLHVEIVVDDARHYVPTQTADAVLLDAPCSATGTLRRHPEIAVLRTPKDVARLAGLQGELLQHAIKMVKPGGLLVYCVCSLQPEEGEQLIEQFLKKNRQVTLEPLHAELKNLPASCITARGELRILPSHWAEDGGMDGFYAARLRVGKA